MAQTGSPSGDAAPSPSIGEYIRLLIADDLRLVRKGIRALMDCVEGVEVVGEAQSAADAIHLSYRLLPDVILMDEDMPGSLLATRLIKEAASWIEIIVMTDQLSNGRVLQAIEAGATGYVLKDIPLAGLASAIRAVCNGQAYFHPEILVESIPFRH